MATWRLLIEPKPATGWWNMALDEALLASAARGGTPTLRLYGWDGAWLSLGHAQAFEARALARCREADVEVLRRVTGGRAVLHGADLTYAITAAESDLPGGLLASYRALSDALLAALQDLGVAAERAKPAPAPAGPADFDCFAEAAPDELCVAGRKLAGSAQRRTGGALLQHGSIRLAEDPPAAARIAGTGQGATSLAALGLDPIGARSALIRSLPEALAGRLGVSWRAAPPAPEEAADARRRSAALRLDPLARRAGPASRAL